MSATCFLVSNLHAACSSDVTTANSANPRIDAVAIDIDTNVAASQAVANNENRTKPLSHQYSATEPAAPTLSQIMSNPYEVNR